MAVMVLGGEYAKDAAANEYPIYEGGPVIDLNPEDWREEPWQSNPSGPVANLTDQRSEARPGNS